MKTRPAGKELDCETHPQLKLNKNYRSKGKAIVITDIGVSQNKNENWVVSGKMTNELHEQEHYDITAFSQGICTIRSKKYLPLLVRDYEKGRKYRRSVSR